MNIVDDFKQFIQATVLAQMSELRTEVSDLRQDMSGALDSLDARLTNKIESLDVRLSNKIEALDVRLSDKIDDMGSFIARALDTSNDSNQSQFDDHEYRITQLEQRTS